MPGVLAPPPVTQVTGVCFLLFFQAFCESPLLSERSRAGMTVKVVGLHLHFASEFFRHALSGFATDAAWCLHVTILRKSVYFPFTVNSAHSCFSDGSLEVLSRSFFFGGSCLPR